MRNTKFRSAWLGYVLATLVLGTSSLMAPAADRAILRRALESITVDHLNRHVIALADDTFEGREAGSRGGRAAGVYIGRELQRIGLAGAGDSGGYYQTFNAGYRNVLAVVEGSDPELKDEIILVGAHYDHVGYGTASNSYGPTGYIHNGADDNASGTSTLLELAEAFADLEPPPKRTLLFAWWDGEEKGLLGSRHWIRNPTLPLERVALAINMDMVGRVRDDRLIVYGSRTARGLRRLVSRRNGESDLRLDFSWEVTDNSDHYPFFARGISILMLHSGLHNDYHRPSDDAEKVSGTGMQRVARLLFRVVNDLAESSELPAFRAAARRETPSARREAERGLRPLPGRLGIRWNPTENADDGLRLVGVTAGSPAAVGGLRLGDRLVRFAGERITSGEQLKSLALAAENPVPVVVERSGVDEPLELSLELSGSRVRLGIAWRVDDAEPGAVTLTRVVPASPADRAKLRVGDRIYEIAGRSFASSDEFKKLATTLPGPLELEVEREGRTFTALIEPNLPPNEIAQAADTERPRVETPVETVD